MYRHEHPILLGGLIVVFALLPIDLAGRNVLFADQWDRYTIYASSAWRCWSVGMIFRFFDGSAAQGAAVGPDRHGGDGPLLQRRLVPRLLGLAARSVAANGLEGPGIRRGTMLFRQFCRLPGIRRATRSTARRI